MSDRTEEPAADGARIRALHDARAQAELAAADKLAPGSDAVASRGCLAPAVVLLKGLPGPAEAAGGAAMSGSDGEAAVKALERLGYGGESMFFALTRGEPTLAPEVRAVRVRALVEALDPAVVLAVDAEAAEDVRGAYGIEKLPYGRERRAGGRRVVAVEGLEASLADARLKARVWRQLQAAAPAGPVF